jgi:hypothetical protein
MVIVVSDTGPGTEQDRRNVSTPAQAAGLIERIKASMVKDADTSTSMRLVERNNRGGWTLTEYDDDEDDTILHRVYVE